MLTEVDKLKKQAASRDEQIVWCKDVIKAAARYERLMVLKDFNDVLEDLRNIAKVHDSQIKGWLQQMEGVQDVETEEKLSENPILKQIRILEVVKTHQYRMNQLNEAINYPEKIIAVAIEAREALKVLTEEEKKHAGHSN